MRDKKLKYFLTDEFSFVVRVSHWKTGRKSENKLNCGRQTNGQRAALCDKFDVGMPCSATNRTRK